MPQHRFFRIDAYVPVLYLFMARIQPTKKAFFKIIGMVQFIIGFSVHDKKAH